VANIKEIDIALFFEREKLTDNAEIQLREMLEFCALPWSGIKAQIREMTIPRKSGDRHGYALSIKGEEAIAWKALDDFVRAFKDSGALFHKARARDVENSSDWEDLG